MKKIYIMALASLFCTAANVHAEEGTSSVPVKMTYVNYSEPDAVYGEIPEGETAMSGYNKIVSGARGNNVEFGNTGWGVNYITYLQVDASSIKGNILSANLTFEASGSTDSKRSTTWGVGYNASEWSSFLTYNDATTGIITMGDLQSTSTKSASEFESLSFDITTALKKSSKGIATILVYETAAAGGYIKNPTVEVNWTTEKVYDITFSESNGVDATVTMDGKNVTKGVTLTNGTYTFTATAEGYQDYTGEFTVEGKKKKVEFTMTENPEWTYIVKNNVNDAVKTGVCRAGTSATVAYSRYILAQNGMVWKKDPCGGDKKLEYNYTFKPDADNYVETLEYAETEWNNGVYFIEAEEIEGMTATTGGNAGVRASNSLGGYAEEPVMFYTLQPGEYIIKIANCGKADQTMTVKAGDEAVLTATTNGSWSEFTSEVVTIETETMLSFEGAAEGYPLDYVLILEAPKTVWNYTIKNNVNDAVKTGTCFEGESVTVPYSRYILSENGTVWKKDATNKEYHFTFKPDSDNYEAIIEYSETEITDGLYFVEGEDIEGMTEVTGGNANIRCSNAAGGHAEEAVAVYTLKPGQYKVFMGVWGNKGATFTVKAGEDTVLTAETQGWWFEAATEDAFTVTEDTVLTFEGSASNKPLDYILITGTPDSGTAVEAIEAAGDSNWYSIDGVRVAEPTRAGLYIHNGKKVIVK